MIEIKGPFIFIALLLLLPLAIPTGQAIGQAGVQPNAQSSVNAISSTIFSGPAWAGPAFQPFFGEANGSNNSTATAPLILSSTIFGQGEMPRSWQNDTSYFHPVLAKWEQFSFYLPMLRYGEFFGGQKMISAAANASLNIDREGATKDYSTASVRQFVALDKYYPGVEEHDDPDRMELNHFLDDDEPPGRPLL
ncbi:MAG TPA: hypothetical protein PLJ25_06695 [Methanothrix sp.]|nr:hypothetical protein [Methanothrix sp.]